MSPEKEPTIKRYVFDVFGWFVRFNYSQENWYIIDRHGYRTTLPLSYAVIQDEDGLTARRITIWRIALEWALPQKR